MILFNIEGIHPHDAVTAFDEHHVAIRAGHHCAQLLMKWLDVPATLRASFYVYNTEADVEALLKGLDEAIAFFKGVFQ
jgi:cysteine desulfurase/selenocysteine lyase